MDFYWHPDTKKQLRKLEKDQIEEVESLVKKFEKEGLEHPQVRKVVRDNIGIDFWRLKIVSGKLDLNHRLFLDVFYDDIVYYGFYHREDAYKVKSLKQILDRKWD